MNRYFKQGAYGVIALSLIISCITGVSRIKAEQTYKDLQVAIRYTDVFDVAQQTDQPIEVILQDLKDKGATTILVRENTLLPNTSSDVANWKAQGKLTSYEGYALAMMYPDANMAENPVQPELNYISINDEGLYEELLTHIKGQKLGGKEFVLDGQRYIEYRGASNTLSTAGMGFPVEDLTIAANMGYAISPQAKTWGAAEEDYIDSFMDSIKNIPNRSVVYFADPQIPGLTFEDEIAHLDPKMVELAQNNQIGFIEFFSAKQKGLFKLAKEASEGGVNYKIVRLHTTTDGETNKLTSPEIISRYWLAATERNQQVLLFKMANTQDIDEDFIRLKDEIEEFAQMAPKKGFTITNRVRSYNLPKGNFILAFLSGLAAIAVFALFLDLVGFRKAGILLGIIGLVGYAGLLKIRPTLALKLMALFGASIFPSYGVLWALGQKTKGLKQTVSVFLKTSIISFGGAITIIGLLSRTSFGLTMDLFTGVKLAHLIPIVLVLLGYMYKKHGTSIDFIKRLATNKVTYIALVIMGLMGLVLMVYTSRTGNSGSISALELAFRSGLDRILGVRPRTKEFIIGYPLMIALFYYGKQEKLLPLFAISMIGQISLVNTYAHVHTPIIMSLIRSVYGIIFGLMIGLILIYAINKVIKVVKIWQLKE